MQQYRGHKRCINIFGLILILWAGFSGCSDTKRPAAPEILIQVNDAVVTVNAFDRAVDEATADFSSDAETDPEILSRIRRRTLNQLTERLILLERARELTLQVSDQELEEMIASIKSDYPKGEFDQVLLEQAVSYHQWRNDLRIRLLMEKVVDHELEPRVHITPQEISAHYEQNYREAESGTDPVGDAANIDAIIIQQVRNSKKEALYREWITALEKRYTLKVNPAAWERIMTRP